MLPLRRGTLAIDLVLSSMLSRLAPALAVTLGFLVVHGRRIDAWDVIGVTGLLCATLLVLTLLGVITGRLARNNGEVHLYGALAAGVLALGSGIAPLPARLGWLTVAQDLSPIARLLASLEAVAAGRSAMTPSELGVASAVLIVVTGVAAQRGLAGRTAVRSEPEAPQAVFNQQARLEA
jgi:hypothetical protein